MAEPAALLSAANVDSLFARLRERGFAIGADQYVAAYDLLAHLAMQGRLPEHADAYRALIGPIVCRTAEEQARFAELFGPWLAGENRPRTARASPAATPPAAAVEQIRRQTRGWPHWLAALLAAALLLWWHYESAAPPPDADATTPRPVPSSRQIESRDDPLAQRTREPRPPRPDEPPQPAPEQQMWLQIGASIGLSMPWIAFAAWWSWRWQRRRVLLDRHTQSDPPRLSALRVRGAAAAVYPGRRWRACADRLRAPRHRHTRHLHADRSVAGTLRKGGYFTPAYRVRTQLPEYLVLIDRRAPQDLRYSLDLALCARLQHEGLVVHEYYYDRDPRRCYPARVPGPALGLAQLQGKHAGARLLICGDGAGLFHPLSGAPERWLENFAAWPDRALLSPRAALQWGYREAALSRLGIAVAAPTPAALERLADWFALPDEIQSRPAPWFAEHGDPPPPQVLEEHGDRWISERPVAHDTLASLLTDLRAFLGEDGYRLLAAMAMYPVLDWSLALHLDEALNGARREARAARLRRVSALPWCRSGYMPEYLRAAIVASLEPQRADGARRIYRLLLDSALQPGGEGFDLAVASAPRRGLQRLIADLLGNAPAHGELHDVLFTRIMIGGARRLLDFELPRALTRLLPGIGSNPLIALTLAGALVASAASLGVAWAWPPIEDRAQQWLVERAAAGNARYEVTVIFDQSTRELGDALLRALSRRGYNSSARDWTQFKEDGDGPMSAWVAANTVQHNAQDRATAERIAARVAYLSYGEPVTLANEIANTRRTSSWSTAPGNLQVWLRAPAYQRTPAAPAQNVAPPTASAQGVAQTAQQAGAAAAPSPAPVQEALGPAAAPKADASREAAPSAAVATEQQAAADAVPINAAPSTTTALGETVPAPRVALVIGNANYRSAPLAYPRNDAQLISRTLESIGFEVATALDADRQSLMMLLEEFRQRLGRRNDTVGLFYYSGLAVQIRGRNYLLPVDADLTNESDVPRRGVAVDTVLESLALAGNRSNLLILEACASYPYQGSDQSASRGLGSMTPPPGTVIVFAAQPNSIALDAAAGQSVFTAALARGLAVPDTSVDELLSNVRSAVNQTTGKRQIPYTQGRVAGDFTLNPQSAIATPPITIPKPSSRRAPVKGSREPAKKSLPRK